MEGERSPLQINAPAVYVLSTGERAERLALFWERYFKAGVTID